VTDDEKKTRSGYDPYATFTKMARWLIQQSALSGTHPCPAKAGYTLLGWYVDDDQGCLCLYRNDANNGLLIEQCQTVAP